jgi:transglutaminase-like putative cysteine protease
MRFFRLCCILFFFPVSIVFSQEPQQPGLPPGDLPPPNVADRINRAGDAADFDSAAYVIVLDENVNRVNELGISYIDRKMVYKVLTEAGCRQLAALDWRYELLSTYIEPKRINIIRGDSVIEVPLDGLLDVPAPQSGIYWQDRQKLIQLPRLQVGDGIEIDLFKKGYSYALLDEGQSLPPDDEKYIPPMPGEYFDIVLFAASVPIVEKIYTLKLPRDKRLHSQVYNGRVYSRTGYIADTTVYSWWHNDIPALKNEPRRPGRSDYVTKVVLATVESWQAKSRWFFDVNEGQFEVTPAIKAKVDEILDGAAVSDGSDEAKAFELLHWVAQNIRYSGQTMGPGEGFTLHSGEMIFEQRSGVCKDIAGMLVTMLRAAGLDSYAAMTNAGARIDEIPADQFNHCVVALRKPDGNFEMYDPTWVRNYRDIWSKSEAEQHYLIGIPEGDSLSRIAYSPPEESPLYINSTARILNDGTLEGKIELDCDGKIDGYLRGLIQWFPITDTKYHLIDEFLGKISERVEIIDYRHGDLLDFHTPMWWEIEYRVPEYALIADSGYEFKSPMMQMTMEGTILYRYAEQEWPEDRAHDLFFYSTQMLDGRETITLPGGYTISDSFKSDEINETYASFKAAAEQTKKTLDINCLAKVKRRQIPPDGYEGFRKSIEEAKEFSGRVYRAEKGGAR